MSLKSKLTLGAVALVALSLFGLVAGNLLLAQRLSDRQERAQAELALDLVAGALADAVIAYDIATIENVLGALVAQPAVRRAEVWTVEGFLLASVSAVPDMRAAPSDPPPLDAGRQVTVLGNDVQASRALDAGGHHIGALRIEMDRAWILTSLRNNRHFNLLFSLGIAIFMATAAYIMAARLARRVDMLRAGAARVAAGDTAFRLPIRGNDEIAQATISFNAMSAALQTERRKLGTQLRTDHLTEASNRLGLHDFLRRETQLGRGIHLLHIDLDHFKQVNDVYGHAAGDAILQNVVLRLEVVATPDHGIVTRVGGDEFILALPDLPGALDPAKVARAVIHELCQPVPWEGRELFVGASVGISHLEPGASAKQIDDAIVASDIALYASKAGGRGRMTMFDAAMRTRLTDKAQLEEEIREGLARGEFVPFLQPQVRASDLTPLGFEVLLRWQHPTRGVLAPGEFLGVIGDGDLLNDIDWTVRAKAVDWLGQFCAVNPVAQNLTLGFNLTERQLQAHETAERLIDMLWQGEIGCKNIAIEILENVVLDAEIGATRTNLLALHEAGCVLELDDFGTGNAALRTLMTVPVGRIKLDRSLVQGLAHSPEQRHILKAITGMARSLEIETLAEGVETDEDLEHLERLGIDAVQGFLCAPAMSLEDASHWLQAHISPLSKPMRG